ncbi:F-box/kelch-repeat protein At3g23880-like isoform X2 [Prosopis cineraria]|uniref:F-box/kelch-repeat protein At3g23880-like isoform X2 n=1 Tax=Prosopis cineraria TaxID=364024 RepID=UPI00240EE259|nr:F-box/kelch-repeat protein At3g23880-like isoform X2 [Prosopis cineraria]
MSKIRSSSSRTMKQMAVNGDAPYLPQDIIRSILKCLPVKYLIRCRCVCKNWKNLLKTPSFILDHIRHSNIQNSSLLLGGARPFSYLCFLDQRMRVQEAQNAPLIGFLLGVSIIGCCNGLLCFQPNNASIFVWNPATREVHPEEDGIGLRNIVPALTHAF